MRRTGAGTMKARMKKEEIITELEAFFERDFPKPGEKISETTNLLQDWFIDSLAIVTTTLFLESRFGISLSRSDIQGDNFQNIASLADLVARRLAD